MFNWLFALCLSCCSVFALPIETFYGPIEVEEEVLLELIESPAFQRLKQIHQYGASYYITHREEYTRYDHSLGVFAILRAKGAPLAEQIAGLLHDVSHTAFSHVGDQIFQGQYAGDDYQGSIHQSFLEERGLDEILKRHGFTAAQVLPKQELFPALEQPSPNLCADRIEYNIQGAFYQGFLSKEEIQQIFDDLQFIDGNWVGTNRQLLTKLVRFSLFMTQDCWGSAENYFLSRALADSLVQAMKIGFISKEEVVFGTDQAIWNRLLQSKDPIISQNMQKIFHVQDDYRLVEPSQADFTIKTKFRGINPWILIDGKLVRLTEIDPSLAEEFNAMKETMQKGWGIQRVSTR